MVEDLSNGPALQSKSIIDELIQFKKDKAKHFGVARQNLSVKNTAVSVGSTGRIGQSTPVDDFVNVDGDVMTGTLSWTPLVLTISGGVLDITGSSSKITVLGESASADDLDTIANNVIDGQFLILQAALNTPITLKNGTGNILIPGGDFVIAVNESVILQYDAQGAGQYRVIANFDVGGGGGDDLGNHTATTTLNMVTQNIINTGNILTTGTSNTIGDATNQYGEASIDKITFTNNVGFSNTEPAIGSIAGDLIANVPTAELFIVRHDGTNTFTIDNNTVTVGTNTSVIFAATSILGISKSGTSKALFQCSNGFKFDLGDFDIDNGDLAILDGDFFVFNDVSNNSRITMNYGAGKQTNQYFESNDTGINVNIASGNKFDVFNAGTLEMTVDNLGVGIGDGRYLQPRTSSSDTIGIVPFRDNTVQTSIGTRGTILLPQTSALVIASQTAANLNTRFGDDNSACGMTFDAAQSTGSGRHRLWIKNGGEWRAVEMDVFSV